MADAAARDWGNPDDPGYRKRNIITIRPAGIALAVHRAVAVIFETFLWELLSRGYDLDDVRDDWGYCNRCQRGTGPGTGRRCKKSNHSWGLAVDANATRNPMGRPLRTDMPAWVPVLAASYGLAWGGHWDRPDPMHFEFTGTPADAEARVRFLTKTPAPRPGDDDMFSDTDRKLLQDVHDSLKKAVEPAVGRVETSIGISGDDVRAGRKQPVVWLLNKIVTKLGA